MTEYPRLADAPTSAFGWWRALRRNYPEWYRVASRHQAHPMPWPQGFDPMHNPVFAHNEIVIAGTTPPQIFEALVRATEWQRFYPNAGDVRIRANAADAVAGAAAADRRADSASADAPDPAPAATQSSLAAGSTFTWTTFSTTQKSAVLLFDPNRALGWSADSPGTRAFHRWILEPVDDGTRVITEECQHGPTAWLDQLIMNPSLSAAHELWLRQLARWVSR